MRIETGGDLGYLVYLMPETEDERELCAAIVECIRVGGLVTANPCDRSDLAGGIQLEFDGHYETLRDGSLQTRGIEGT